MLRRNLFPAVALIIFVAVTVYSLVMISRPVRPNVILITVESLRNDLVSADNLPNLIEAAQSGVIFIRHRAVSGWTGTNIVSLLTGLSPFASGVHTRGQSVAPELGTALEQLGESGYRVEGIQGFMAMDIYRNLGLQVVPEYEDIRYRIALLADDQAAPFFTWYHYVHTHLPYHDAHNHPSLTGTHLADGDFTGDRERRLKLVRDKAAIHFYEAAFEPGDREHIHDLQASSIREFDDWFGEFWEFFTESGLNRSTILVVTADHGDEHGERGFVGHASTTLRGHLHEEIVRVPLFIWLPEELNQGQNEGENTRVSTHEDIMTTLLDLLGQPLPPELDGRNLFTVQAGSEWFGMTSSGGFAEPDPNAINYFEYAMLSGEWKLRMRVQRDGGETLYLYNLDDDPDELENRASAFPEKAAEMASAIRERIARRQKAAEVEIASTDRSGTNGSRPAWIAPLADRSYRHEELPSPFALRWSGSEEDEYILEYLAGSGNNALSGSLNVKGTSKDFGTVSRRYWNTWVVPASPFRLRVRRMGDEQWSEWVEITARP